MNTIKNYKGQDCETFWSTLSSNKFEYFCAKVGPEFWNHHVYLGRIKKKNDGRWDVWILNKLNQPYFKQQLESPLQLVVSTRGDAIKKVESIWLEKEEQKMDKFKQGDLVVTIKPWGGYYQKGETGRIMYKVFGYNNYNVKMDKNGSTMEIQESDLILKKDETLILKIPAKEHRIEYVSVPKEDLFLMIGYFNDNVTGNLNTKEVIARWKTALGA